jgi:hypothetical protein
MHQHTIVAKDFSSFSGAWDSGHGHICSGIMLTIISNAMQVLGASGAWCCVPPWTGKT